MTVEPDTVLMQDGAEQLRADARDLSLRRQLPTEHVNGAGHYYNHGPVGEADTQGPYFIDDVVHVWRHSRIREVG